MRHGDKTPHSLRLTGGAPMMAQTLAHEMDSTLRPEYERANGLPSGALADCVGQAEKAMLSDIQKGRYPRLVRDWPEWASSKFRESVRKKGVG